MTLGNPCTSQWCLGNILDPLPPGLRFLTICSAIVFVQSSPSKIYKIISQLILLLWFMRRCTVGTDVTFNFLFEFCDGFHRFHFHIIISNGSHRIHFPIITAYMFHRRRRRRPCHTQKAFHFLISFMIRESRCGWVIRRPRPGTQALLRVDANQP